MEIINSGIRASAEYRRLVGELRGEHKKLRSLNGVTDAAKPYFLDTLADDLGVTVFYIMSSDYAAKTLASSGVTDGVYLPAPRFELRNIDAKGEAVEFGRIAALAALRERPRVVYTSDDALCFLMRPPEMFLSAFTALAANEEYAPQELMAKLTAAGYSRTTLIEGKGQCSGRGEILEIYPPNAENPLRITYFDDMIETMRWFDADTQRSFGEPIERITIPPAREMLLSKRERESIAAYMEESADKDTAHIAARYAMQAREFGWFDNIEAFAGAIPSGVCVTSYAEASIIVYDDAKKTLAERERKRDDRARLLAGVLAEGGAFVCREDYMARFMPEPELTFALKGEGKSGFEFSLRSAADFSAGAKELAEALKERMLLGWTVYLFAGGKAATLSRALLDEDVVAPVATELQPAGACAIVPGRIYSGFEDGDSKSYYLSEKELFGKVRRAAKARSKQPVSDLFSDLKPGDVVVHDIHGKGRFLGLRNITVGGVSADYMEIEYRDGDKLYVQTAQIERVSKFIGAGGDSGSVVLSRLGGKDWDAAKTKARGAVKELAEDLVSLYREREHLKGFAFSPDTVWQKQFEDNFEYEETEGQLSCIKQIKHDMESERIMDRLVMGDVGYGKTEVAMRACFKAVMDSKQVAVLVPTTLLARQHYESFRERFKGFPVTIAALSRFTDKKKTLAELARGKVDIIIGTHRLLGKDVVFRDLGLLVIDEEQRFGVSHKERIKNIKRSLDVLTLSATPIPRTLQMAMTQLRDMSTIDTPPQDRKEIQAYVSEFSWGLVRDVILKELARGGQAYFVCRKIAQMDDLLLKLSNAVPEARICVAHGKLSSEEFERVITSFYEHEYDVLLCTTIIESGIDIPAANSIIIYEADKYGLAQLYQLKGRVGRSTVLAYAYFTHIPDTNITELAQKRLAALTEFTRFGSGQRIAMRDLEIRGAGNLLGAEQSGHISSVGYNLYCELVREEVGEMLGTARPKQTEAAVEIGVSAFIPTSYIPDEAQRLDMYREIGMVVSAKQAAEVRDMLYDRYGTAPREVENLLVASLIRTYACRAGIASVINKQGTLELKFDEHASLDYKRLLGVLSGFEGAELKLSTPPMIVFKAKKGKLYTQSIELLGNVAECVVIGG